MTQERDTTRDQQGGPADRAAALGSTLPPAEGVGPATPAVGVFDSRDQAAGALEALRAAGFTDAQIGVGTRAVEPAGGEAGEQGPSGPPTWENGAGIGGMIGASLGGLAGGPVGLVGGALAGGLIGALLDLGIPETDARWYSSEAEGGRVVVMVRAPERRAEAQEILTRHGAREAGAV
jgi:hypothetical protein